MLREEDGKGEDYETEQNGLFMQTSHLFIRSFNWNWKKNPVKYYNKQISPFLLRMKFLKQL